jgi:predicted ABC-type ATPase
MPNHPRIRVFAGPNGSGKTTLYEELSKNYSSGYFINADEIEKKLQNNRLIDLSELGLKSSQEELNLFKDTSLAISLLSKAELQKIYN